MFLNVIVFIVFIITSLPSFSNAQTKECYKGLCVGESEVFYTDVFYQGQNIVAEYFVENITDSSLNCYFTSESHFTHYVKRKKEVLEELLHMPRIADEKPNYSIIEANEKWEYDFNQFISHIGNDYYKTYDDEFNSKNKLKILLPGKYSFSQDVYVGPNDKKITFKKNFEVKEAKGQMKIELIDYLKSINFYLSIENDKDYFYKMFDENLPTIVWFMRTHPRSIYSAEPFRFLYKDSKYISYKPSQTLENEVKEWFVLMNMYKDIRGNLAGTRHFFNAIGLKLQGFKQYALITSEVTYMDNFLKGIEDKPVEISERLIGRFKRMHQDAQLTNYAREKQQKK